MPVWITKLMALKLVLSMSVAFANSSAWVIKRVPLSSRIALRVTGPDVGASLTGVMSSVAVPNTDKLPSLTV